MTEIQTQPNGNLPAVRHQPKAPVAVPLSQPLVDLDQAWRAAGILGRSGLLPDGLRTNNPETTQANVCMVLWYGAELGLAPMQALQSIYIVKGKPQMSGQLWMAKVREAGHKVTKDKHTVNECTLTIVRGDTGEEWTETFTIEDARTAKLLSNDVWSKYPKRMLLWRAITDCARAICPEVALGFGDESEVAAETASAALAQAVDARTPTPEPVPDEEPVDAELIDEEPDQSDEDLRREVMGIAAEHQGVDVDEDGWPPVAQPGGAE